MNYYEKNFFEIKKNAMYHLIKLSSLNLEQNSTKILDEISAVSDELRNMTALIIEKEKDQHLIKEWEREIDED